MTLSEPADSGPASGWQPPDLAAQRPAAPQAVPQATPAADNAAVAARARQEGYDAGFAKGEAEGRAQVQRAVGEINALLRALEAPFAESETTLVRDLLEITERVARAVLRRDLETNSGDIEAVIEEGLAAIADSNAVVEVTMHPSDALLCREFGLLDGDKIVIRENAGMHRGGVELRAGSKLVDASVEARLQTVLEALHLDAGLPAPSADARSIDAGEISERESADPGPDLSPGEDL
ncbi:MAG: hypothetical protein Cons2KO_08300 [Congregibacter sp.]